MRLQAGEKKKKEQLDGLQVQPFRLTKVQSWETGPRVWGFVMSKRSFRFFHPIIKLCRWPLRNQPVQGSPCTLLTCTAASLWEKTLCSESNCPGKKTTKTSGTDQFLPGWVFTWIFKLSKNRQELFYYSTTELGSIWETQLFFSNIIISHFSVISVCGSVHVSVQVCLWVMDRENL